MLMLWSASSWLALPQAVTGLQDGFRRFALSCWTHYEAGDVGRLAGRCGIDGSTASASQSAITLRIENSVRRSLRARPGTRSS